MIEGTLLRRDPSVASVVVEAEAVLVDASGDVHVLSPSGTAVWEALDGATSAEALISELSEAYGVATEVLAADVLGLLADFRAKGLLIEPGGASSSRPPLHQHEATPSVLPEPPST